MTVLEVWGRASESIEARAKEVTPRQVALALVSIGPFLIFFAAYFVWKFIWTALTWTWSAGVEGWDTAKRMGQNRGEPWA